MVSRRDEGLGWAGRLRGIAEARGTRESSLGATRAIGTMTPFAAGPLGSGPGAARHGVRVTFLDGTELQGTVESFDPQRPMFRLYVTESGGEPTGRDIFFQSVKMIAFLRDPAGPKPKVTFPSTARLVTVRFLDREMMYGVTQSYGGARAGLFLVPTIGEDIDRIYVPVSAIREVGAKRLGDILVEQGLATPEMIERALQGQRQLRQEVYAPIGRILQEKGLISDQQLAQGLAVQQQRPAKRIGEILIEQGFIDQVQLDEALEIKARQQERDKKFGEILVDLGYATHKMIAIALAIQYNLPFIDLSSQAIDPQLRTVVPAELARRWKCIPVNRQEHILTIAVADPREHAAQDAIRDSTGLTTITVVATPPDIARTMTRVYGS